MYYSDMKTYLYFAYGMNTNVDSMGHRCPAALDLGSATLLNHRYRFSRHADVLDAPPHDNVEGVLWDITKDCLESLDILEGYPSYYDRKTATVMHRGVLKEALVYFMQPGLSDALPSQSYLDMVLTGFYEHGISTYQIEQALIQAELTYD
jgi:gamma-glutamylcyclotransferase (GGCT)/AIG2-like uncharacterized protein YtfP